MSAPPAEAVGASLIQVQIIGRRQVQVKTGRGFDTRRGGRSGSCRPRFDQQHGRENDCMAQYGPPGLRRPYGGRHRPGRWNCPRG